MTLGKGELIAQLLEDGIFSDPDMWKCVNIVSHLVEGLLELRHKYLSHFSQLRKTHERFQSRLRGSIEKNKSIRILRLLF